MSATRIHQPYRVILPIILFTHQALHCKAWKPKKKLLLSSWIFFVTVCFGFSYYPHRGPASCRMWLALSHLSLCERDKSLLIDDLCAPSSSHHLSHVVFASPHSWCFTSWGCHQVDRRWKADRICWQITMIYQDRCVLSSSHLFPLKHCAKQDVLHLDKEEWEGDGWDCLTLWVSPADIHHCSWREKETFTPWIRRSNS